ncbi:hypothetical protein E4T56_gene2707 [Termitomyces sp. T112]|nr:hypothetical protein E4T56_gene2707 [Termitomyces sp. T112]
MLSPPRNPIVRIPPLPIQRMIIPPPRAVDASISNVSLKSQNLRIAISRSCGGTCNVATRQYVRCAPSADIRCFQGQYTRPAIPVPKLRLPRSRPLP